MKERELASPLSSMSHTQTTLKFKPSSITMIKKTMQQLPLLLQECSTGCQTERLSSFGDLMLHSHIMSGNTTPRVMDFKEDHLKALMTKFDFYSPQTTPQASRVKKLSQASQNLKTPLKVRKPSLVAKEKISLSKFVEKVEKMRDQILHSCRSCHVRHLCFKFETLIQNSVRTEDPKILALTLHFLSQICLKLKEPQLATYLGNILFKICNIYKDLLLKNKLDALILLGKCAREIKEYPASILLFKKSLQYAWILNQQSLELSIYDQLGLSYYFSGDNDRALFYHERAVLGGFESNESSVKKQSNHIMHSVLNPVFFRESPPPEQITQALLTVIHLPFVTIENGKFMIYREPPDNSGAHMSPVNLIKTQKCIDPLGRKHPVSVILRNHRSKTLENMTIDASFIIHRIMGGNEFQSSVQTPKAAERDKFIVEDKEPVIYRRFGNRLQVVHSSFIQQRQKKQNKFEDDRHIVKDQIQITHFSHNRALGNEHRGFLYQDLIKLFTAEFEEFLQLLN